MWFILNHLLNEKLVLFLYLKQLLQKQKEKKEKKELLVPHSNHQ